LIITGAYMGTGKINDVLEENFMTAAKFSLEVEKIVKDSELNYIEAIVMFCEEKNIEIENVGKLINKPLKEKLKYEAQRLNFIKKGSRGFLSL
jgi:hypothetical protein